ATELTRECFPIVRKSIQPCRHTLGKSRERSGLYLNPVTFSRRSVLWSFKNFFAFSAVSSFRLRLWPTLQTVSNRVQKIRKSLSSLDRKSQLRPARRDHAAHG